MPLEPLTQARYPTQDDGPYGGDQVQAAVLDLAPFTVPRFDDAVARDLAYAAWTEQGNTPEAGMVCYTAADDTYWSLAPDLSWGLLLGHNLPRAAAASSSTTASANGAFGTVAVPTDLTLKGFTRFDASHVAATYPGWYLVSGAITWSGNATGRRIVGVAVNDVLNAASQVVSGIGTTASFALGSAPILVQLAGGDRISVQGYQDSGVALTFTTGRLYATYAGSN